jgi:pseudouridine kinase
MLTNRQTEILELVRRNPMLAQQEIADRLDISRSAVAGHIMALTELGLIRGRGYVLSESDYVCVVGGANIDVEGRVPGSLAFADSNPGIVRRSPGGVGRNISENLARLKVPTRLITAFGRDQDGTWLHGKTADAGVDLADCVWSEAAPTATYLSVIDNTGEMVVAVNDMAVMASLDRASLDARGESISNAAVVVADCNLDADPLGHVVGGLARGPVFVDPVSSAKAERIKPHLDAVHTLKPNRAEASLLSGVDISGERSLHKAASALLDDGVQHVVISLGADGVFFSDGEASGILTLPTQAVASVTGAGDALMTGLIHAHLAGLSLEQATGFALAAASITASSQQPVAQTLSAETIVELMENKST